LDHARSACQSRSTIVIPPMRINATIRRRQALIEAGIAALIAAMLALAVFAPILKWIATGWSGGDMLATYVDADVWHGFGYVTSQQYGYPLGMDKNYFPGLDITQNTFASVVTLLTGKPFLGVNLLIMLTFPLVAFLTYFLVRMAGLTGPLAIAAAATFSLIPFHFGRALGHTYLGTLYSAVTGMILVLLIGSGRFEQMVRRWRRPDTSRRSRLLMIAGLVLLVVVTAWSGIYYAAFTLILGAAAVIWRFAHRASWRALLVDALPFLGVIAFAVAGALPSVLAIRADPPIAILSERLPYESVIFAGYLAVALLPIPQSSLPGFDIYNRSVSEAIAAGGWVESAAATNHGTWVTTAALLVIVIALITRTRNPQPGINQQRRLASLSFIVYLILVTVLWFIPWGLNYLFAGTITAQIRAWNRLTPYLLLLFLLGAAAVFARLRIAQVRRWSIPLATVILALTFVDSVLPFRGAYADNAKDGSDLTKAARSYAAQANAAIEDDCGVLQLPYMGYPEIGIVGDINDYDHFWTSINNSGKHWSYGAIKNTDAGIWSSQLPEIPNDEQIALLRGNGFCAIHIDQRGWSEKDRVGVVGNLQARFGSPIAVANSADWLMFDISAVEPADPSASKAFIYQPSIQADPITVHPRESELTDNWWWTRDARAVFAITPIREDSPITRVRGSVTAPDCGPRPVTITLEGGDEIAQRTLIARPKAPADFELTLPTGLSDTASLTVHAPGPPCEDTGGDRNEYVQVSSLRTY